MLQTSYEILISDWCSDVCSSDLGSSEYFLPIPLGISGGFIAGDLIWSTYRIYAAAFAAAMIGVLWMFLNKTPYGAVIKAGAHDSEMVRALGYNLTRLRLLVFGDRKSTRLNSSH